MAPGQRVHVRRAPGVSHVWVALTDATLDNGCPGWSRASTGAARCCTTRWSRSAGSASAEAPAAVPAGSSRRGRGVLVADPAPDRPEPDRRRAQGLHRPVPPGRMPVLEGDSRSNRPHRPVPAPTRTASTRSSATADPSEEPSSVSKWDDQASGLRAMASTSGVSLPFRAGRRGSRARGRRARWHRAATHMRCTDLHLAGVAEGVGSHAPHVDQRTLDHPVMSATVTFAAGRASQ